MKYILSIFFLVFTINLHSQILNGTFDEWELVGDFEKPTHWITDDYPFAPLIYKDKNEDNTWLRFQVDYQEEDICGSRIYQKFSKSELMDNLKLAFDLRTTSLNSDSTTWMRVKFIHFKDEEVIEVEFIEFKEVLVEFTEITVDIASVEADSLRIELMGAGILGPFDGCFHESIVEIDNVRLSSITSTNEYSQDLRVYPNPVRDVLIIEDLDEKIEDVRIFSSIGELVHEGEVTTRIDVSFLSPGIYHLMIAGHATTIFEKM